MTFDLLKIIRTNRTMIILTRIRFRVKISPASCYCRFVLIVGVRVRKADWLYPIVKCCMIFQFYDSNVIVICFRIVII